MNESLTFPIPVDRIVEVQNSAGDTLCINPRGQKGWHVQVVRGGQRHRNGGMQILVCLVEDKANLFSAVESFFNGNYNKFDESEEKKHSRWWGLISILVMMISTGIALAFLAFMISYFMNSFW